MNALSRTLILATALLAGPATLAGTAIEARPKSNDDIEWAASRNSAMKGRANVHFTYRTSSVSIRAGDGAELAAIRTALELTGTVNFTISREAGTLTCRGAVREAYNGSGTCTFAPDRRFAADLRSRGLAPRDWSEQLSMTLLDVDRSLIDGLTREGVPPRSADDAIGAAALQVTTEYVAGLKRAGLDLRSLEDAIACRALEVDAAYVKSMVEAGYSADVQQVIAMKAVGVTPNYARRMNTAVQQ